MTVSRQSVAASDWKNPERPFDVGEIRKDFPILQRKVHGKSLVYLDNAATSQKPQAVIDAIDRYYSNENSNIHRGVHQLSEEATKNYEDARKKIRRFINAPKDREIVFVRSTTEAINLVAQSYGRKFIRTGEEIVISAMEHHSNIVPWQMLCEATGAKLRVIPISQEGEILFDEYRGLLNDRTRLVSVAHVSNALGTINPVKEMVEEAHHRKIPVFVDGAQAAPHMKIDVQDLGCDFYAFSGHKLFGPTGIGVLYGKASLLEAMPPYQGGGDMISLVTFEKTHYNVLPYRFEAGTPNIAGGIGLGAAIDYLDGIGFAAVEAHESQILSYATEALSSIPGLRFIGTPKRRAGVISFLLEGIHAHDIGTILDQEGVAIRTGHHCAMPVMQRFGVPATARASFAFYNTKDEVGALVRAMGKVQEVFG